MKGLFVAITLLISCHCFCQKENEVYLIGSIHSYHLNEKYKYSLEDLLKQIIYINPNIVCGEITPEAYNTILEGYFPPEAAMLAELAPRIGYKFIPVDWRCDFFKQQEAEKNYPKHIKEKISTIVQPILTYEYSGNNSLYNHIHSKPALDTNDKLYEIIENDSIANMAHGFWRERNREIANNAIKSLAGGQRIVIVLGADHISRVKKELENQNIKVIVLDKEVESTSSIHITSKVVNRWEKNLINLKMIVNKQFKTSENYYNKIINSNRISELQSFINYYN